MLLGNNKACKIDDIGSIKLRLTYGTERILQEVRHVPELKRNLVSLVMLDSYGFSCRIEGGILKVTKGSLLMMKAKLVNGK